MTTIGGVVGSGGGNAGADVRQVQTLLNAHAGRLGYAPLKVDGLCGPRTIQAIEAYQRAVLGMRAPDGFISPGGRTLRSLGSQGVAANARQSAQAVRRRGQLSGRGWFDAHQAEFPNSASTSTLAPGFAAKLSPFLSALRRAGATVSISSTRRNSNRAWVMHYAWRVAKGQIAAAEVPANAEVDIQWDHGSDRASRAAAQEMVDAFGIRFKPSLTSNHIRGTAIDMTIRWSQAITVVDANGRKVAVDTPRNGNSNTTLHAVGATFGVRKLATDPPHWSENGR